MPLFTHGPRGPLVAAVLLASTAAPALARVDAASPMLTDNAVIERDRPLVLGGKGKAGTPVSLVLDDGAPITGTVAADGTWQLTLPAQKAGGSHRLTISADGTTRTLRNLAFGDVFLCSGQSNMEFPLRKSSSADEVVGGANDPDLRLFAVPRQSSITPKAAFASPVSWAPSTPDSAREFSAVCHFLGREMRRARGIPVGLIASSWSGSIIEDWLPLDALRKTGERKAEIALLEQRSRDVAASDLAMSRLFGAYFTRTTANLGPARAADPTARWEDWGGPDYAAFDGTAVYTATVNLTPAQAASARAVTVGQIDDMDQTMVNGQPVGSAAGYAEQRRYALPKGLMKPGENRITVRVLDTGGGGGLWGDGPRAVETDGGTVPLTGWQIAQGTSLGAGGQTPLIPWIGGSGLTTLYNGMIAPIGDYPLAGIAWYQGEANVGDAPAYSRLLTALIAAWRAQFSTRPFVMAQLANFGPRTGAPQESLWAALRDVQRATSAADPQVGLATTLDVGDPFDIHPTQKMVVARRMALAFGGKRIAALPQVSRSAGTIALRFDRALHTIGGADAVGFELCPAQGPCRPASARLTTPDTVTIPAQATDTRLRFLWADSPVANLFDADDAPVPTFTMPLP